MYRQSGFSLVELMIAVTIGLLLLAGVVTIVANSSRTHQELEKIGQQVENGRYALELMQRTIPHAGYYGEYYDIDEPSSIPDPCSTDPAAIDAALELPIHGYDSPTGDPAPTCISDADHEDGTDILVIRRASTTPTAIDSLTANELYLQSLAINHVLAQADGDETAASPGAFTLEKRDGSPATIRKLHTEIYFIGTDDGVPTLKRLELNASSGTLDFEESPLVSGIEMLQIDYGIDRNGDGIPNETDPGVSDDAFVPAPANVEEWFDVVAVRVHLLARNIDPTSGYTDTKLYDIGKEGQLGPMNDGYRRHAYVATIRAVNPSLRRE